MNSGSIVGRIARQPGGIPGAISMLASLTLAAQAAPVRAQVMACDPCVIGVVLDSPWERNAEMLAAIESAVIELTAPRFDVVFPAQKRRAGDTTRTGVRAAVAASLADPVVDLVLAVGPVATTAASRRDSLPKPVVGVFARDPNFQAVPMALSSDGERISGKRNFSYIALLSDVADDVRRFRRLAAFDRVTFLVAETPLGTASGLKARLNAALAHIGPEEVAAEVVRVPASAAEALEAVPAAAEAVYVTPLPQLPPDEFDGLIRGLNRRRLPTFSSVGRSAVDAGLLMSLYDDVDSRRLGRRVALHVQRLLRGEDAGTLPIDFHRGRRLTLNMATARAIGVYPDWHLLTEAELLHEAPPAVARRLSLVAAAQEAVAANLDLAAAARGVAAGRQIVRESRAVLRPHVFASGVAEQLDRDRARASFGFLPAWLVAGSVGVSQILYSDAASAEVEVQKYRQIARTQSLAELRLDIVHAAAVGYLEVLRAINFERIERNNLTVTRSNLHLAAARQRIGAARASEVVRWENEIATSRRAVINVGARRRVAETALNRLLHRPLEEPFEVSAIDMDELGLLSAATFERYARNPYTFVPLPRFRDAGRADACAGVAATRRRGRRAGARRAGRAPRRPHADGKGRRQADRAGPTDRREHRPWRVACAAAPTEPAQLDGRRLGLAAVVRRRGAPRRGRSFGSRAGGTEVAAACGRRRGRAAYSVRTARRRGRRTPASSWQQTPPVLRGGIWSWSQQRTKRGACRSSTCSMRSMRCWWPNRRRRTPSTTI